MGLFDSSNSNSANTAWSNSASNSIGNSWSNTAGIQASQQAIQNATNANSSALEAWKEAAEYNAKQAEIQRTWQEKMANTQYQRAVADMKQAGLNPILAVANGLSGASVGSGEMASMTAPNSFMANTFAEQNSASTSSSNSNSESESNGWSHSESGLATWLTSMAGIFENFMSSMSTAKAIEINFSGLKDLLGLKSDENPGTSLLEGLKQTAKEMKEVTENPKSNNKKSVDEELRELIENQKKKYHHSSGGGRSF